MHGKFCKPAAARTRNTGILSQFTEITDIGAKARDTATPEDRSGTKQERRPHKLSCPSPSRGLAVFATGKPRSNSVSTLFGEIWKYLKSNENQKHDLNDSLGEEKNQG